MTMTAVFAICALVSAVLGILMPHLVHWLGFDMALIYLGLGAIAAIIDLSRRDA